MKKRFNTICSCMFILLCSCVLGTIFLYSSFKLPISPIQENVAVAVNVFRFEGISPPLSEDKGSKLDNWTDSLMLINASFDQKDVSVLEKAIKIYRPLFKDDIPTDTILEMYAGAQFNESISYTRYWHGYLVVLKPFLYFANYVTFRKFNEILIFIFIIFAAMLLCVKKHYKFIIPFLLTMLFIRPTVIAKSIQYSVIFYVTILSLIVQILFKERLEKTNNYILFYFVIGIVTSYLDLLTYPLLALGLSLTFIVNTNKKDDIKSLIKRLIFNSIAWVSGYALMWIGKWTIAYIFSIENVFQDAYSTVLIRTSRLANEVPINFSMVLKSNLENALNPFFSSFFFGVIIVVISCIAYLYVKKSDIKDILMSALPYIYIFMLPFCWYFLLLNHSFFHAWFTFRTLGVGLISITCFGIDLLVKAFKKFKSI